MTRDLPHDYYEGRGFPPDLHARNGSKHYIEPDYIAMEADDQLPLISTVGAGPEGEGVFPEIMVDEDDDFRFVLKSNETGEVMMSSPNLSAGRLSVTQPAHTGVEGEQGYFTIRVNRGGSSDSYTLAIPPGAVGSRIYTVENWVPKKPSNIYVWSQADLFYDGSKDWTGSSGLNSKPKPRVNDIILFESRLQGRVYISVGHIESVENTQVVASVLTYFELMSPYIKDGEWFVGDTATGVVATGPKGDKGTFSAPTYRQVEFGEPLRIADESTDPSNMALSFQIPKGKPGDPGKPGAPGTPGLPATMVAGTTGNLPNGAPTQFSIIKIDGVTNTYQMNLSVASGASGRDGTSIHIVRGIHDRTDLPPFESTPVNDAYVVKHTGDLMNDLYIRGKEADPNGWYGWTIVDDWQGVPGRDGRDALAVAGETYHLEWGDDAIVLGRTPDPNDGLTYFDFYIPDILPDIIPIENLPFDWVTKEDIDMWLTEPLEP